MRKIKILVADNSFLIREGIHAFIKENNEFKLIAEAEKAEDLHEKLLICQPDVLLIDYTSNYFCMNDVAMISNKYPDIKILAITNPQNKEIISKAIECGVLSHLLKDCGKEEIIEAIYATAKGEKFFCGIILHTILKASSTLDTHTKQLDSVACMGIKLSNREIEIIQLVAEGLTNKQMADKLFLSAHTVTTHRKNIMSKLGINNTAGLVMFAIKENLIGPNKFLFAN
jgi:DNA-binding NarL/FixJ family response regulator